MTQNVQEIIYKKEKIRKKKIDFISEIFVATERDRQRVQEKKFKCQNNKIHQIKFGYYPDANNFEIEDSDIQKN